MALMSNRLWRIHTRSQHRGCTQEQEEATVAHRPEPASVSVPGVNKWLHTQQEQTDQYTARLPRKYAFPSPLLNTYFK